MPPMNFPASMPMMHQESETNLLSILINIAFGFVAGLIIFLGFKEVIAYGTALAQELFQMSPQGQQMAAFSMAATYAPYIVLAPLTGMVLKQLSSVRSLKGFGFFLAAFGAGIGLAFLAKGTLPIL